MGQNKRKKSSGASVSSGSSKRSRKKQSSSSTTNTRESNTADASKKNVENASSVDISNFDISNASTKTTDQKPLPILILDSGGWTVKHGTVLPANLSSTTDTEKDDCDCSKEINHASQDENDPYTETPNCTAKLRHQIAVLVGDEIHTVKNKAQLEINYPLERGYCTDFVCQLEVWKRVLKREQEQQSPQQTSDTTPPQSSRLRLGDINKLKKKYPPSKPFMDINQQQCAFLLTQPFTPTTLSDRLDEILFTDLGFQRVSKRLIQCMAAFRYLEMTNKTIDTTNYEENIQKKNTICCLVVDSGFSLTHIVPTVHARAVVNGIRRINIGGKLLTNLYKEAVSYRQWNMMDEFFIMNDVKETTSFISNNFHHDLAYTGRESRIGFRHYDREFILPNFVDTFAGSVRLPAPLEHQKQQEQMDNIKLDDKNEETEKKQIQNGQENSEKLTDTTNDNTVNKNDEEKHIDKTNKDDNKEDDEVDSDQETEEDRMKRIKQLKLQERRRREMEKEEQQVLSVSVERFTIPEVLFHPTDIGLDQLGIVQTIVQSIQACDTSLHAAMYQNILLTGGNAKIPGFKERIENELRACAPGSYEVNICLPDDPTGYAWLGARDFVQKKEFLETCCLDKPFWEAIVKKKAGLDDDFLWSKITNRNSGAYDKTIVV